MTKDDSSQDPFRKPSPFGEENPFSENPYSSPALQSATTAGATPANRPSSGRGMVGHVQAVAILMVLQGALELIMALMLIGMSIFLPIMLRADMELQRGPADGPAMPTILTVAYLVLGLMVLCAATLHIFAGVRNYGFRNRSLGIAALITGMATTLFTCYCAPTAIALGVYGLICLTNAEVSHAFAMGDSGTKKQDILTTFR